MYNPEEITRISKYLSLGLRHRPDILGIELDENGWTDVSILLSKLNQQNFNIDISTLKYVVESNTKKRFIFDDTQTKIRANQGHSIDVDLGLMPQKPPQILFHGTGAGSVQSIFQTGLEKRGRNHVHLSSDIETAIAVGRRHGKSFIFEVSAGKMHDNGFLFYISENGVWLTDHVPVMYLTDHDRKQEIQP